MPNQALLRPADFAAATLHPDQMITLSVGPTLAPRNEPSEPANQGGPTFALAFAAAAFAFGFAAGQFALALLR